MPDTTVGTGTQARRIRDLGGGVFAPEVVVMSPASVLGQSGAVFLSSSGKLSSALTASNVRAIITAPASKSLVLAKVNLMSTVAAFCGLFVNPTAGLPTATRPAQSSLLVGGPAAGGVVKADTNAVAISGGTDTGLAIGVGPGQRVTIELPPLILPAGQTLGLNLALSAAGDAALSIVWSEV